MSNITSAGNLSVNSSLSVGGNSILGTNSGNTLICNAIPTLNNDLNVVGNIVQQSTGSISSGTGGITSNGDLLISSNKNFTSGSGLATYNGVGVHYATETFNQNITCNGITNNSTLNTGNIEISSASPAYIDMKTTGNNNDFDARKACAGGSSGTVGQGTLTISSASTIINSPVNVNASVNCTSINNSGTLNQTGGDIVLSSGRSVFITDGLTNYVRMHNSGTTSVIDFTGNLSFRNNGLNTNLLLNSSNDQATFGYNLNTTGITNSTNTLTNNVQLSQVGLATFSNDIRLNSGQSVYVTDAGTTNYLRMHHSGTASVIDFTGNLSFRNNGSNNNLLINSSTNQATFGYNLNTTGITNSTNAFTNNAVLNQNNSSNFSTTITAPSIISNSTFYAGTANNFDTTAISNPKVYNGIASGTGDGASYTNFNLAINSWQGVGFVYSNSAGPSVCKLVIDNRTGDLKTQGIITCDSINVNKDGELSSLYRNNIKNYNIRGNTFKSSGTHLYSWLLSSTQQIYTTNITTLPIDSTCFSMQILYTYYSTGTNLYQGATPYYILKYGSGGWISNGGSVSNTEGAFQFQPLFNVSSDNTTLNIYHTAAVNNNDYVYFTYKVEMY